MPSSPMRTRSSARSISFDMPADSLAGSMPQAAVVPSGLRGMAATVAADYRRHGARVLHGAFIALCLYRFGRWGTGLRSKLARGLVSRLYGFANLFVANVTKIWIPPAVTIGRELHIVNNEGSLSIHPDTVIGDRLGVMHNVTIGTNMGTGAPVIGDDVFIGVNSTVLGAIRIGDRVRIAANTAVTTNVPSDSIVIGSPARIYPRLGPLK